MAAFVKTETLIATRSSEAMLSFSRAGWHHLQSRENRQRKVLFFHYVFYPQAQSVAWNKSTVNILQIFFCKTSRSMRDLADHENNVQLSPSKSSISSETHSWLKRRDMEAGGKVQCSKEFKRWTGWDETEEMNGWHWVLGAVLLITARAGHPAWAKDTSSGLHVCCVV